MKLQPSQLPPPADQTAPVYPFATVLRPAARNRSRRPSRWARQLVRCLGLAVSLAGLLAALYSCR